MKKLILVYSIVFTAMSVASAATINESLYGLFSEYNRRYSTGSFVSNDALAEQFIAAQENQVRYWQASGNLIKLLTVKNDHDSSLVIDLFLLVDEANNMLAFYYQKSQYFDREEQSFLRFKTLNDTVRGLGFVSLGSGYALTVTGHHIRPELSGTLQMTYLQDLRKGQKGVLNLFLIKKNNVWSLFSEDYKPVSSLFVKTWKNIFPPNGGVSQLILGPQP